MASFDILEQLKHELEASLEVSGDEDSEDEDAFMRRKMPKLIRLPDVKSSDSDETPSSRDTAENIDMRSRQAIAMLLEASEYWDKQGQPVVSVEPRRSSSSDATSSN